MAGKITVAQGFLGCSNAPASHPAACSMGQGAVSGLFCCALRPGPWGRAKGLDELTHHGLWPCICFYINTVVSPCPLGDTFQDPSRPLKLTIVPDPKIYFFLHMQAKSLQSHPTLCDPMGQAPLSTEFSRQEHGSGLPCPPPGDLPDPGIEPESQVSGIGRWVLYHQRHLGGPFLVCACLFNL